LKEANWSTVLRSTDADEAYRIFIRKVKSAFNEHFPLTKLSRNRMKDRRRITRALKKVLGKKINYIKIGPIKEILKVKANTKLTKSYL